MPPVSAGQITGKKKTLMAAVERAYQRLCCDILSAPELCWLFVYSGIVPPSPILFKQLKCILKCKNQSAGEHLGKSFFVQSWCENAPRLLYGHWRP
jgi:hypothetical protein